jgi:hypothetical protein
MAFIININVSKLSFNKNRLEAQRDIMHTAYLIFYKIFTYLLENKDSQFVREKFDYGLAYFRILGREF